MLADVSEAACRTLDHPSVPRLEKFIAKLVKGKMESGQLDNCDLTLRELSVIQESFVTTLAGYYHSRIKYPNQKDPDEKEGAGGKAPDEKAAPQDTPSEKTTDEKPAQTEMPLEKSISPDVKNYLQIDLGLAVSENPAGIAAAEASASTAAPEQAAATAHGQPDGKDNKEE